MILKVYSVYDRAVSAFMQPFYARSHGEAMRMFLSSVKNSESFSANAEDYALYYLAEYNDELGEFGVPEDEKLSLPLRLMTGMEAIAQISRDTASPELELNGRLKPAMRIPRSESVDVDTP